MHLNITKNDIEEAVKFLDLCDMACQLSERVTFGSTSQSAGHTMMIDLVDFIID